MIATLLRRELLATARTGQAHRFRMGYGLLILLETITAYLLHLSLSDSNPAEARGPMITLTWTLIAQQYILIFGLAPILAAGSVIPEKSSGTLIELMVTPIRSSEIILAKWLAIQVRSLDLVIIPLPTAMMVCGFVLMPGDMLMAMLMPLIWLPMVVAFGVLASVQARQIRSASGMTTNGVVLIFVGLIQVISEPWIDPVPTMFDGMIVMFSGVFLSGIALGLATWRLRSATLQHGMPTIPSGRFAWTIGRKTIGENPIRWLETHRGQKLRLPLVGMVSIRVQMVVVGCFSALIASSGILIESLTGTPPDHPLQPCLIAAFVMIFAFNLAAATRGAVSLILEREQKTWESLRTTPLTARQIVRGKVWGIVDAMRPYFFAYLIVSLPIAGLIDIWGVPLIFVVWLTMWVTAYWWAALGVRESVRYSTTLVALGRTIGFGYMNLMGNLTLAFLLSALVSMILTFFMSGQIFRVFFGIISGIFSIIVLMTYAELFMRDAIRELTDQLQPRPEQATTRVSK